MRLVLDHLTMGHQLWSLTANGIFFPGVHLVSGDVGSGKSTLALMMAGLLAPESGTVIRDDIPQMMLSFQFPEYHVTGLSVAEECRSWDLDPDAVIRSAGIDVTGETAALSLSRGELKRLHLACVLARDYDLLLLDEPFSSLDCPGKEWVCGQLNKRAGGITVIFTHEQSIFPDIDHIWEIVGEELADCGDMPGAVVRWQHAPPLVKKLICTGRSPLALTPEGIREAACRTRG
ncbi:MAG: ATP-binding cassette domain-containing protein [Methanoregula sp.]|jgi:energy-coupling factor transport system ATP-binding protein|uniref:ATP-binding cassette domain-containing protein n=1 Tax=Methanoregula sp. TaxID=2052170 RepID=UPI003C1934CD